MLVDAARDIPPRGAQGEIRAMQLQMAEARVKLGDDSAVHECRAALFPATNDDLEITALACQIIGNIDDRASINQLITLTAQRDAAGRTMPPEVRLAAAAALAKLGLPKGAFIAREYIADASAPLRAQAAFVLGDTGQLENLGDLEPMLADPEGTVRVAASASLLKITESVR